MKVYINNYRSHWLSPYSIMERVLYWKKWTDPEFDLYDDKNKHYTNWLVPTMTFIQKCLDVIHPKIDYVKIDRWDTWSMDTTLSIIILPMLKQLHLSKHGAPIADDVDVPDELKSTVSPPTEEDELDGNHFKRWEYIISEMIWAFEQKQPDCDWEDQFISGVHDRILEVSQRDKDGKPMTYTDKPGPNDTYKMDIEGLKKHQARIDNGLRLFGKYYSGLWD